MIQLKVFYDISFPEDRCDLITPDENEVSTFDDLMQIVRNKLECYNLFLMKNCGVCLWRSPPSFNSQECEGMRSRVLAFEASGIDHVGLIQICFSAEATVSRVCEKTVYLFR